MSTSWPIETRINMARLLSALLMNPRKLADDGKYLWNVHPTRFRKRYLISVPVILRLECEFYLCTTVWIVWIVYPRGTAKAYAKGRDRARNAATSKRKPHALFFSFAISDQRKFSSNNPHPHIYPSYVPTLAYFTDFLTCCQICSSKAKHTIMHHLPLPFYFSLLLIIDLLSAIAR